jgi:hypothetical protein
MDFTSVRNRRPFELQAHLRLQALCDLRLIVPVGILSGEDKPFSELVILDRDGTEIGVMESPQAPGRAIAFTVFLNSGQEVELGRSTEVMVDGLADGEVPFRLADKQHAIN